MNSFKFNALFVILSLLVINPNLAQLQFYDVIDSTGIQNSEMVADGNGGWLTINEHTDSSLYAILFDFCGDVSSSFRYASPNNLLTNPKTAHHDGMFYVSAQSKGVNNGIFIFRIQGTGVIDKISYLDVLDPLNVDIQISPSKNHIFVSFAENIFGAAVNSQYILLDKNLGIKKSLKLDGQVSAVTMSYDSLFYTTINQKQIACIDTSGKVFWSKEVTSPYNNVHGNILTLNNELFVLMQSDSTDNQDLDYVIFKLDKEGLYLQQFTTGYLRLYYPALFISSNSNGQQQISLSAMSIDTLGQKYLQCQTITADMLERFHNAYAIDPKEDSITSVNTVFTTENKFAVTGTSVDNQRFFNAKTDTAYKFSCQDVKLNFPINKSNIQFRNSQINLNAFIADANLRTVNQTGFNTEKLKRICEKFILPDQEIPHELCKGEKIILNGNFPNAMYKWENGSQAPFIEVTLAGSYKQTITYCGKSAVYTHIVKEISFTSKNESIATCEYPITIGTDYGPPVTSYTWNTTPPQTTPFIIVTKPGIYKVNVVRCQTIVPDFYNVSNLVIKSFNKDTLITCNDTIDIGREIPDGASVKWNKDNLTSKTIQVIKQGTYVADVSYCNQTVSYSYNIKVECPDIKFPNVISPNSQIADNKGFKAYIDSTLKVTNYHLEIYNRWGAKLFESNDAVQAWDGNYKGKPSPADTYMYLCTYRLFNEDKKKKGVFTIVR